MPSPICEINSASLGGWTSTENGVDVALGEAISIRLADTAGVVFWTLEFDGTDEEVVAPTLTVDTVAKTASFTAPSTPTDGWTLLFKSTVGVGAIGKDGNFALREDYVSMFGVYTITPGGFRVGALNETQEGNSAFGWVAKINPVLREPPGAGSAPTGAAGGNLSGSYPNPTVAKIKGTTITTAGGALTTGQVLRVTGASTADWGALDLANTNAVTGNLAISHVAPGANGQVLTTASGVPSWATIADANISSSAAIAVSKLAPGTNGQYLQTSGGIAVWAPLVVALSTLAQGGAVTGQALIWSGSAWAPGSDFGAQNLVTTGTFGAHATTVTTLSATALTATSITDSTLGTGVVHSSSGGLFSSSTVVNADVSSSAAIAVTKLATGTLGQVLQVQAGPTNGWSTDFNVQSLIGVGAPWTGVWVGEAITPSATNYLLASNGADGGINAPTGSIFFSSANVTRAYINAVGFLFEYDNAGTRIGQINQAIDAATHDLTVQSQAPFASATGSNRNSGNLNLVTPAPVAGGTGGSVFIKPAATTALTLSAAGALRLNAYTTAGFLKNDGSGNVTSSATTGASTIAPGAVGQMLQTGAGPTTQWSTDFYVQSAAPAPWLTPGSTIVHIGEGITPGLLNYSLLTDGADYLILNAPGPQTSLLGFNVSNSPVAYITDSASVLGLRGFVFQEISAYTIGQTVKTTDVAANDLTIQSQAPFATATGANKNPGNIVLTTPSPVAGGADGFVKVSTSTHANVWLGIIPGAATFGSVWVNNAQAPTATNYALAGNGVAMNLNAPAGSISFNVNDVQQVLVTSTAFTTATQQAGLNFHRSVTVPLFGQNIQNSDTATFDLTVQSQAPFATATTNKNPGNLILAIPAPVAGGLNQFVKTKIGSTVSSYHGLDISDPSYGNLWLGPAAPTSSNYAISCNGASDALYVNAPAVGTKIQFSVANSQVMQLFVSSGNVLELRVNGAANNTIGCEDRTNADIVAQGLVIKSAAPYASATVNKAPGNITLTVPSPAAGGSDGFVKTSIATVPVMWQGRKIGASVDTLEADGTDAAIYLGGNFTPSATNWAVAVPLDGGLYLNGADGNLAGGNRIVFNHNGVNAAVLGSISNTQPGFRFAAGFASPVFGHRIPLSDAATVDLLVQSQGPFATATVNKNSANLIIQTPAPVAGGTAGSIFLKPNATTALTLSAAGALRLNAYTAGTLVTDSSGNVTAAVQTVAPGNITQGGAAEGQALIWHTSAWTPSTDFSAQNLVTTGTLSVGSSGNKTVLRPLVGAATFAALYLGNITADAANYTITGDGANLTVVNAPGSSSELALSVNNSTIFSLFSDRAEFVQSQAAKLTHATRVGNNATADLTITSQAPYASATGSNRNPGNLILSVPSPIAGGTSGFVTTKISGNKMFQVSDFLGDATFGTLWLGNVTPSVINYSIAGDGLTDLYFNVTPTGGKFHFVSGPGGGERLQIYLDVASTQTRVESRQGQTGVFGAEDRGNDFTADSVIYKSAAPFSGATGTHRNSGNVTVLTPAPVTGGTAGTISLQVGGSDAFVVNTTTKYTLFGSPTFTTGTAVPSSSEVDGSLYARTGSPNGSYYFRQNGAWVLFGASGSGGPPSGPATGDLSGTYPSPTVAKINGATVPAAGSLTAGNVLQVSTGSALTYAPVNLAGGANYVTGALPLTNLAQGGAVTGSALLWSGSAWAADTLGTGIVHSSSTGAFTSSLIVDADVTSVGWSKITGTPTTLAGYGITNAVPSARVLTTTAPLQIAGTTSADLSVDRTLSVLNATTGAVGVVQLAGDLGGTGTSPSVLKIKGTAISTAGGGLTTGQVLRVVSAATADWGALDLANTSAVTGVLHVGNLPSLAGDVTGTVTANTVVALTGTTGTVAMHGATLQWDQLLTDPLIWQSTATADATDFTIQAQNGGPGNSAGGNLILAAGIATGSGSVGVVGLQAGGTTVGTFSPTKATLIGIPLYWDSGATVAGLNQSQHTSGNGNAMKVIAQAAFGTGDHNGGDLWLVGGAQHGAGLRGSVIVKLDAVTAATFSQLTSTTAALTFNSTPLVQFDSALTTPKLCQADVATGNGVDFTVAAQNTLSGLASAIGGNLVLAAGGAPVSGGHSGDIIFKSFGTIEGLRLIGDTGVFQFAAIANYAPRITQAAVAAANGQTMSIIAQNGNGTNKNGGTLALAGGVQTGIGRRGGVQVAFNADFASDIGLELAGIATTQRVVALLSGAPLTTTNVPSGDRVLFIGNCATIPTANSTDPVGGVEVYATQGALYAHGTNGFVDQMSINF